MRVRESHNYRKARARDLFIQNIHESYTSNHDTNHDSMYDILCTTFGVYRSLPT